MPSYRLYVATVVTSTGQTERAITASFRDRDIRLGHQESPRKMERDDSTRFCYTNESHEERATSPIMYRVQVWADKRVSETRLSVCLSVFTISLSFASLGIVSTLYYRGMKTLVSRRIQQRSFREMRRLERKNKYKGRLSGEGNIFLLAKTIAMIGDQLCVPECYFSFSWLISGDCELTTWWLLLLSWVTNSRDNLDCITRIC